MGHLARQAPARAAHQLLARRCRGSVQSSRSPIWAAALPGLRARLASDGSAGAVHSSSVTRESQDGTCTPLVT